MELTAVVGHVARAKASCSGCLCCFAWGARRGPAGVHFNARTGHVPTELVIVYLVRNRCAGTDSAIFLTSYPIIRVWFGAGRLRT